VRPGATVYDVEALKHFVYLLALGVDGTKNLAACVETVRNYWNRFTAGWKRKHELIRQDIVETITNVNAIKPPYTGLEILTLCSTSMVTS
jgi:predicted secreted Zn-dependent protease